MELRFGRIWIKHNDPRREGTLRQLGKRLEGSIKNWIGWYGRQDDNLNKEKVGNVSAILEGTGTLTIEFGNCWDLEVKLYLDSIEMAVAPKYTYSIVTTFSFNKGSLLEVRGSKSPLTVSVIMLNSIDFDCTGMMI